MLIGGRRMVSYCSAGRALFLSFVAMAVAACGSSGSDGLEVECDNGDTRIVSCGANGLSEQAQVCRNYQWENDGFCIDKTECTQGTTSEAVCGYNDRGTVALRCGNNGQWRPADTKRAEQCEGGDDFEQCICDDPDVCVDGDIYDELACGPGDSGHILAVCTSGQWVPEVGASCEGADECVDGEEEHVACGLNERGTHTWVCEGTEWSVPTECNDPDECVDEDRREKPCFGEPGLNRVKVQIGICEDGQWGEYTECVDLDECVNGKEEFLQTCGEDGQGNHTKICEDGQWNLDKPCHQKARQIFGTPHGLRVVLNEHSRLFAMGNNATSQLGTGSHENRWLEPYAMWPIPTETPVPRTKSQGDHALSRYFSASTTHQCAIDVGSNLWCWGDNRNGQLGPNAEGMSESADPVQSLPQQTTVQSVAVGEGFSCALTQTGVLYCWGDNRAAQIGIEGVLETDVPQEVMTGVAAVSAGRAHVCVLTDEDDILCWGSNSHRQVANIEESVIATPTLSELSSPPDAPSPGDSSELTLGWMAAAGDNTYVVWNGYEEDMEMPVSTFELRAVGSNAHTQLGLNADEEMSGEAIMMLNTAGPVYMMSWYAVGGTLCYMETNMVASKRIFCIGDNRKGKFGPTSDENYSQFKVFSYEGMGYNAYYIRGLALGEESLCILVDGRILCRGGNDYGQLGDGTTISRDVSEYVLHRSEME